MKGVYEWTTARWIGTNFWIMLLLIVWLCMGCATRSSIGDPSPHDMASRHALSPRSMWSKPARALTLAEGQMIVSIARSGRPPVRQQILASPWRLPLKNESFFLINVGNAYIDKAIAKELRRVTEREGFALVLVDTFREFRFLSMNLAGWIGIGNGEYYAVYRKVKGAA